MYSSYLIGKIELCVVIYESINSPFQADDRNVVRPRRLVDLVHLEQRHRLDGRAG